jgi:hypothetical protein
MGSSFRTGTNRANTNQRYIPTSLSLAARVRAFCRMLLAHKPRCHQPKVPGCLSVVREIIDDLSEENNKSKLFRAVKRKLSEYARIQNAHIGKNCTPPSCHALKIETTRPRSVPCAVPGPREPLLSAQELPSTFGQPPAVSNISAKNGVLKQQTSERRTSSAGGNIRLRNTV